MNKEKTTELNFQHYFILTGIIILGTGLRFWQLDAKFLWIDEIFTAIFSLGRSYQDIPLNVIFYPANLVDLLTINPQVGCGDITHNLILESTHPPLFFCLSHQWLNWLQPLPQSLIWKLRALPALLGVFAILAVYYLNRLAFCPQAGLMAAIIMAVSPFAVYLSQEARHYTLPLLLITLSLIFLVKIQQDLNQKKQRIIIWFSWSAINTISFYVHYFCLIAFVAQIVALILLIRRQKIRLVTFGFALLPLVFYLPWLPILIKHFTSSNASWLPAPENVAPLYQTLINLILMVISLPIESQPIWLQIFFGLLMIIFAGWLGRKFWQGWRQLEQQKSLILSTFLIAVLIEFLIIIYILQKDISVAPRYNFIYYPAICALLGASLIKLSQKTLKICLTLMIVGIFSSILVVYNLAFQKPYHPEIVASQFAQSSPPVMVIIGYEAPLEIAMGLGYALALEKISSDAQATLFYFADRTQSYDRIWQKLSTLSLPNSPKNLWVIAPGLIEKDYPTHLDLVQKKQCKIDRNEHYRIGFPYQLYRCS